MLLCKSIWIFMIMKRIHKFSVPYICKFCYVSIDRLQIASRVLCDVYGPWIIWVVFSVIFKHTLSMDQCLITPLTHRSCGLSNLKHWLLPPLHLPAHLLYIAFFMSLVNKIWGNYHIIWCCVKSLIKTGQMTISEGSCFHPNIHAHCWCACYL